MAWRWLRDPDLDAARRGTAALCQILAGLRTRFVLLYSRMRRAPAATQRRARVQSWTQTIPSGRDVWSAVMRYLVIPTAPIAFITVARYERQSWTQTIPANFWSGLIESWTVAHLSQHPYGELRGTSLSTPSLLWSLW
jgi:hypothetical protein